MLKDYSGKEIVIMDEITCEPIEVFVVSGFGSVWQLRFDRETDVLISRSFVLESMRLAARRSKIKVDIPLQSFYN